jgi:hypothetical protein
MGDRERKLLEIIRLQQQRLPPSEPLSPSVRRSVAFRYRRGSSPNRIKKRYLFKGGWDYRLMDGSIGAVVFGDRRPSPTLLAAATLAENDNYSCLFIGFANTGTSRSDFVSFYGVARIQRRFDAQYYLDLPFYEGEFRLYVNNFSLDIPDSVFFNVNPHFRHLGGGIGLLHSHEESGDFIAPVDAIAPFEGGEFPGLRRIAVSGAMPLGDTRYGRQFLFSRYEEVIDLFASAPYLQFSSAANSPVNSNLFSGVYYTVYPRPTALNFFGSEYYDMSDLTAVAQRIARQQFGGNNNQTSLNLTYDTVEYGTLSSLSGTIVESTVDSDNYSTTVNTSETIAANHSIPLRAIVVTPLVSNPSNAEQVVADTLDLGSRGLSASGTISYSYEVRGLPTGFAYPANIERRYLEESRSGNIERSNAVDVAMPFLSGSDAISNYQEAHAFTRVFDAYHQSYFTYEVLAGADRSYYFLQDRFSDAIACSNRTQKPRYLLCGDIGDGGVPQSLLWAVSVSETAMQREFSYDFSRDQTVLADVATSPTPIAPFRDFVEQNLHGIELQPISDLRWNRPFNPHSFLKKLTVLPCTGGYEFGVGDRGQGRGYGSLKDRTESFVVSQAGANYILADGEGGSDGSRFHVRFSAAGQPAIDAAAGFPQTVTFEPDDGVHFRVGISEMVGITSTAVAEVTRSGSYTSTYNTYTGSQSESIVYAWEGREPQLVGTQVALFVQDASGPLFAEYEGSIESISYAYDTWRLRDANAYNTVVRPVSIGVQITGGGGKTFLCCGNDSRSLTRSIVVAPAGDFTALLLDYLDRERSWSDSDSSHYDERNNETLYTDREGVLTVAIAQYPTEAELERVQNKWRVDLYSFDSANLKFVRRKNATHPLDKYAPNFAALGLQFSLLEFPFLSFFPEL